MTCAQHVHPDYDTQVTKLPDGRVEVTNPNGHVYRFPGDVSGWVVRAGEPLNVVGLLIGAVTPPAAPD